MRHAARLPVPALLDSFDRPLTHPVSQLTVRGGAPAFRRSPRGSAWAVAVAAMLSAGCSGESGSPTSPTPGGGSGSTASCRTYPTSQTTVLALTGLTSTLRTTAQFNASTNQYTSTVTVDGSACVTTTVLTYPSRAAFIDEVRFVPGVSTSTGETDTASAACAGGVWSSSASHDYDSQGRILRVNGQSSAGAFTWTFTRWDARGRPVASTLSPTGRAVVYSYDESRRAARETGTLPNGASTTTETLYDGNAIVLSTTTTGVNPGTSFVTTTGTDRICK